MRILLLSFSQYLASRVLLADGWASECFQVGQCVAAGELGGNNMGNLILMDVLEAHHAEHALTLRLRQWVDDLNGLQCGTWATMLGGTPRAVASIRARLEAKRFSFGYDGVAGHAPAPPGSDLR